MLSRSDYKFILSLCEREAKLTEDSYYRKIAHRVLRHLLRDKLGENAPSFGRPMSERGRTELACAVRKMMKRRGWTVGDLSLESGVSISSIRSFLTYGSNPRLSTLQDIAWGLDADILIKKTGEIEIYGAEDNING